MKIDNMHVLRRTTQILFILLIALMPVLNILWFDSETRTLIVLGSAWDLGLKEGFYAASVLKYVIKSLGTAVDFLVSPYLINLTLPQQSLTIMSP
ncbi:MAG: hypothetical protein HZC11_01960 [Nitrospirae bacterium]|nr:hypothetical protein [Nitrospirota bacterium]